MGALTFQVVSAISVLDVLSNHNPTFGSGAGRISEAWAAREVGRETRQLPERLPATSDQLFRITEKHLGQKYDSKQISRIVAQASQDLEAWRLEGRKYKFLYVDGANFAVRINGQVSRQSFCAVLGVSEEGECFEVLAVEMGNRERTDLWENVFGSLIERGLNAEAVELGIMDGLPGLEAVFKRFFQCAQNAALPETRQGQRLPPSAEGRA